MLIYSLIIIYYIRCADNHEKQSFIFHFNLLLTIYVEIRSHKVNLLPPPFPENMSTDITEETKKEKKKLNRAIISSFLLANSRLPIQLLIKILNCINFVNFI